MVLFHSKVILFLKSKRKINFFFFHFINLGSRPVYFIIFQNVLIGTTPIKIYDLKGSTEDRFMSEKDIAKNPKAPLKDENFLQNKDKVKVISFLFFFFF